MELRFHQIAIPPELTDSMPEDPHAALIQLSGMIPKALNALPIPIGDGSRMASDRAASPGVLDLPILCEHYMGGSEDFLTALLHLMMPRPNTLQIPRFSLYPLIRGVIESSGQTVWVLGAAAQRERFRRLLQVQKDELKNDIRWVRVRTRPQDSDTAEIRGQLDAIRKDAEHKRRTRWRGLLDSAAALGIDRSEFEHGLPEGYEGVIRQAVDEQGLDFQHGRWSAATWVFLSGLSHPSMSRAWAGSVREQGEISPDGSMVVRSEADPARIRDGLGLAVILHVRAVLLWKKACAAPSAPGGAG
jgi:hypothetical protein